MSVKLRTEHHLEFLNLKGGHMAHMSLHLSNATLLKITCHGSYYLPLSHLDTYLQHVLDWYNNL